MPAVKLNYRDAAWDAAYFAGDLREIGEMPSWQAADYAKSRPAPEGNRLAARLFFSRAVA
jgi:hypothetical protein